MASVPVPEKVASHLGAILLAFNRQIFGSFLDEADELARAGQPRSAILIAGTVLEYLERTPATGIVPSERFLQIKEWRELRNLAAHDSAGPLTVQQARLVINGVRGILTGAEAPGEPLEPLGLRAVAARALKGKYSHVATSSGDFIRRKLEDLEQEDRG